MSRYLEEEYLIKELAGVEFGNILRQKRPFKDLSFSNGFHGQDTHRIQLHCIMRAVRENPSTSFSDEELQVKSAEELLTEVYAVIPNIKTKFLSNRGKCCEKTQAARSVVRFWR